VLAQNANPERTLAGFDRLESQNSKDLSKSSMTSIIEAIELKKASVKYD
jgi:hypothetical protein